MSVDKKLTELAQLAVDLNFDVEKIRQHIEDVLLADFKGADSFDKKLWQKLSAALHPDKHFPENEKLAKDAFDTAAGKYQPDSKKAKPAVDLTSMWGDFTVVVEEPKAYTQPETKRQSPKAEKVPTEEEKKLAELQSVLILKHNNITREYSTAKFEGEKDFKSYLAEYNNLDKKDLGFIDTAIEKETQLQQYLKLVMKRAFNKTSLNGLKPEETEAVFKLYDEVNHRSNSHIAGKIEENYRVELALQELFEQFSTKPHRLVCEETYKSRFKAVDVSGLDKTIIQNELIRSYTLSNSEIDNDKCAELRKEIEEQAKIRESIIKSESSSIRKNGGKYLYTPLNKDDKKIRTTNLSFFRYGEAVNEKLIEKLLEVEKICTSIAKITKEIHFQTFDENLKNEMRIQNSNMVAKATFEKENKTEDMVQNNRYLDLEDGGKMPEEKVRKIVEEQLTIIALSEFKSIKNTIEASSNPLKTANSFLELQTMKLEYVESSKIGIDKVKKIKEMEKIEGNVSDRIDQMKDIINNVRAL